MKKKLSVLLVALLLLCSCGSGKDDSVSDGGQNAANVSDTDIFMIDDDELGDIEDYFNDEEQDPEGEEEDFGQESTTAATDGKKTTKAKGKTTTAKAKDKTTTAKAKDKTTTTKAKDKTTTAKAKDKTTTKSTKKKNKNTTKSTTKKKNTTKATTVSNYEGEPDYIG